MYTRVQGTNNDQPILNSASFIDAQRNITHDQQKMTHVLELDITREGGHSGGTLACGVRVTSYLLCMPDSGTYQHM